MGYSDVIAMLALISTFTLGFLQWLRDKRKSEVDAETVKTATETAQDESSVRQALELRNEALQERKAAIDERKATAKELSDVNKKIDEVSEEVGQVRQELNYTRQTWRTWAEDLHIRWDYHRSKETPPPLPDDDGTGHRRR